MPQAVNIEEVQAAVQALLNERVEVVNDLLQAAVKSADLRREADEAERETGRLFQAAVRQGWTVEELKRVGIADPTGDNSKAVRRRSAGRRPASNGSDQAAAEERDG